MSRIGKKAVAIPSGVTVTLDYAPDSLIVAAANTAGSGNGHGYSAGELTGGRPALAGSPAGAADPYGAPSTYAEPYGAPGAAPGERPVTPPTAPVGDQRWGS